MKKKLTIALLLAACAVPATAQNWSLGVRSGAFVFGDFIERRVQVAGGDASAEPTTLTLSAATRPGLAVDLERRLADRWAIRAEGTFTNAPLTVKDTSESGTSLRAGEVDVTTLTLPLVFRINTGGSFRFHILGGPAYAMYKFEPPTRSAGIPIAGVTKSEFGLILGGGVTWHVSERFGIEGAISDVATTSPFDDAEVEDLPGFTIPKPHNVHTTVGIRYRF